MVNAAAAVQDLRVPPGNHLEALKGDHAQRKQLLDDGDVEEGLAAAARRSATIA
jgi:hypothetical protein